MDEAREVSDEDAVLRDDDGPVTAAKMPAEPEGMNLTDNEARALALRLVAGWAQHSNEPEWEDVPNLGEHAYERLNEAIVTVAGDIAKMLRAFERQHDIDSAYLLEQTRA